MHTDGQAEFDDDEHQLDPEGQPQDAEFLEAATQALILDADADGRENISTSSMQQSATTRLVRKGGFDWRGHAQEEK